MRICIVDRAAGSRQIPLLAQPLRKLGHQVDVIYSPWPVRHYRPNGLYLPGLAALNDWPGGALFNKLPFALMALAWLGHRRLSYDVVHIEEPLAAFLNLLLPGDGRPPVVFSTMGPMPAPSELAALSPQGRQRLLFRMLGLPAPVAVAANAMLASNLRRASRVVLNSDALREALIALFDLAPDSVDVVPTGVDTDLFHPGVDGSQIRAMYGVGTADPLILTVGPVQPRKGQLKLLEALPRIVERHPQARLMIVGPSLSPPYERALKEFVASHGLGAHVIFTGPVPHQQIPQYYAAADLFVLLSTAEGMPEVILEAMSCGRACVASAIPNNREAAPGGDEVLFVDPDDTQAVAEAINGLLGDPVRREELGLKARHTVLRHFRWEVLAQQMVRVYEKVLAIGGK